LVIVTGCILSLSSNGCVLGTLAPDKPAQDETMLKSDSPYAMHYGPDAPIWSLYLKETEAEDRELVELWQTDLDSLLLFVSSQFRTMNIVA
jgi:hypothetical protein